MAVRRIASPVNAFSTANIPAAPVTASRKPRVRTTTDRAQTNRAAVRRAAFESSPEGAKRLSLGSVGDALAPHVGVRGAMDTMRHEQNQVTGMVRSKIPHAEDPTIGPKVPDINAPHETDQHIVPQRRWEDMHPHEQEKTLREAAKHGVTMDTATRDYTSQLMQAHDRAHSENAADPYSSRFYAGKSAPRDALTRSANQNAQHPNWPSGVDPHGVQAVANAITSPRNKFSVTRRGSTVFPNDEHANHAIQHVLNMGPNSTPQDAYNTVTNSSGPAGGGLHGNIKRAAYAAHQMIYGGVGTGELTNPQTKKQRESGKDGNPVFGQKSQQKTTAYAGGWLHPNSADAFLTTDVHTGHGFAAHLGTAKVKGKQVKGEKTKVGGSEVENYISKTPNVHQLHDYIARQVHASLGLSPSVSNAQYLHRGQGSQWGEERISRPDLTDSTHATAYPPEGSDRPKALTSGQFKGVPIKSVDDDGPLAGRPATLFNDRRRAR